MNFGAFAGGLSKGLEKSADPLGLKKMMMGGGQGQGAPQMAPGFEDPNAIMSQAPLPMSISGQPDQFAPAGGGTFGGLKDLMIRLFGGIGG